MILLDMRTVVFLNVVMYLICTILIAQLWRQYRRRFAGVAFWALHFSFQTVALALIILRGAIPDWISIVLANTLMFAGGLLLYMGLERFVGKIGAQLHNYAVFVLYTGAFVYFTFIHPDFRVRTLIVSAGVLILSFQSLWLLWRRVEPDMRPMTFGVGLVFGAGCLVCVVRIVEYFVGVHAGVEYFQSGNFQTMVFVAYQVLFILLTYSLVLMVNNRLHTEVRTHEEKFAKAFHSAPYAIALSRLADGKLVEVNEGFVAITGHGRGEVIGKKSTDLHIWERPEDRAAVVAALSKEGKIHGLELSFRKKNGDPVTGLFSAELITIDGERSILSSISDITGRKRMEEELRRSHDELEVRVQERTAELSRQASLLDLAHDAIIVRDPDGRIVFWNKGAAELYGYSREEAVGRAADELLKTVHPEPWPRIEAEVRERKFWEGELEHRTRDGRKVVVAARLQFIPEDGGAARILETNHDITLQKEAGEALRESENRLRRFYESGLLGVIYWNLNGEITDANSKFLEMVGYDREDLEAGRLNWRRMTPPEYRDLNEDSVTELKAEGVNRRPFEKEYIRKDGTRIPVLIAGAMQDEARFNGVAFVLDITDRRRAEERLRQNEENAKKAGGENEIIAHIGRIIGSTLKIEEVYKNFSDEVGKLLEFNSLDIDLIDPEKDCLIIQHVAGTPVRGRETGAVLPLAGTAAGEVFKSGTSLLVENVEEKLKELPGLKPAWEAGRRTMLFVPLISENRGIGTLVLASGKEKAYAPADVSLAERVAAQIAGAIAHARLFAEREQAEEALRKSEETARHLAMENETIAEIGRIAGLALDTDKLYQGFGEEAKKIIPFDRILINTIDPEKGTFKNVYIAGDWLEDREAGKAYPLAGSANAEMARTKVPLLIQTEDFSEYQDRFPTLLSTFQAGFRSILHVPLFSKGEVVGGLLLRSRKPYAYADKDVRVAERIASQIAGAIANAQLFEARKEAEAGLLKSEESYRRLVELSPFMIMAHQRGKYVYANPAALKALGASNEKELLGKSIFEVIHPDYRHIVEERIGVLERGEALPPLEEKYIRLDKRVIDVEVTHVQTLPQDEPVILIICRDITEQKKAEKEKAALQEKLQQSQKMEAIGTLAGGIAHDFNNILAAILGYAELAGFDTPKNSKAKYNLEQSMKAALRARDLVHQILTFSRQGVQDRKLLNIRPIVKEGLKFMRASLPATVEIRQDVEKDLGTIEADPTKVYQVLMNLCTNAAQAMEEKGGVLSVSLESMDVAAENASPAAGMKAGPYVRLRVGDTGQGMTPEIRERIFEPYFTTKEVGKGTGLGLAVVHGIVESCGGGIAVSSEAGKGSVFDVYFPRIEAAKSPAAAAQAEPLPLGGRERVLFVDDEKAIAEIGKETLALLGYEVEVRTSSVEALELFRAKPERFDLVITDMTMPNMTGDRLARELMRIRPGIPVILATGFSERITEEKAKAMGIREFVMKPLIMMDLAKAIRRALEPGKKKAKG